MRNLEQELKLQLDEREYNILAGLTTVQPVLQTNYYFQSAHLPEGTVVRLREKKGTFILCCKWRLQYSGGVMVSDERECEVDKEYAQSLLSRGIMPLEINRMLKVDMDEVLLYTGKMETYRTAFKLGEWDLELDKSIYCGQCDYELECECQKVEQLEKLKNYLSYNYGIVIRYSSPKIQRFLAAKKTGK